MNSTMIMIRNLDSFAQIELFYEEPFEILSSSQSGDEVLLEIFKMQKNGILKEGSGYFMFGCSEDNTEVYLKTVHSINQNILGVFCEVIDPPDFSAYELDEEGVVY